MNFNFSRLGTRLVAVLTLIMMGFIGIATAVWLKLGEVSQEVQDIGQRRVPQVVRMVELRTEVARIQSLARQSLLDDAPEKLKASQTAIGTSFSTIQAGLDDFARYIFSDKARQQVTDMRQHLAAYASAMGELEKALASGNREAALAQLDTINTVRAPLLKVLEEANDWQQQIMRERTQKIEADAAFLKAELAVMAVLLLLIAVTASVWLMKQLRTRLAEATGVAQRIAANDLAEPVAVTGNDEFTALLREMASMRDALHGVVAAARQASDSIQVAATEVASGNQDLSSRTEAAASNLEETASSMEEITATVRQSADAASQANQLASSATEVAVRGGQVVSQVVSTMNDINRSSQQIADIIGVIDGIAFQTNILALNAAVEAARAGEQGRGFAVVAGEVRNLAQRSAQAAKEIKDLISASVDKVQSGSQLVQDAGHTMDEIVASVQRVTDVMAEITAAAAEQSNGIAQVNVAVTQLDQMTQQNAALVEESTAAAESLRDQAEQLNRVVSVFKLGNGADLGRPTTPPRPRAPAAAPRPVPPTLKRPQPASAAPAIANKPSAKSTAGQKPSKTTSAPPPELKRPAPASRGSVAVAKPSDSDGDWESF